jgi:hypothetical protein
MILDAGNLEVSGIPYKGYDVYVYFGADEHGGAGSVTISSSDGKVDENPTYYYKIGWLKGEFVPASATSLESVKDSNCVVFKDNTAKAIQLEWAGNLQGAKTGVTGVQIVEQP